MTTLATGLIQTSWVDRIRGVCIMPIIPKKGAAQQSGGTGRGQAPPALAGKGQKGFSPNPFWPYENKCSLDLGVVRYCSLSIRNRPRHDS